VSSRLGSLRNDGIDTGGGDAAGVLHRRDHRDDADPPLVAAGNPLFVRLTQTGAPDGNALLENHLERFLERVRRWSGSRRALRDAQPPAENIQRLLNGAHALLRKRCRIDRRPKLRVKPEVDPEGTVRQLPDAADLGAQVLSLGEKPRQDSESPRVGDFGRELRPRDPAHARLQYWVVDLEKDAQVGVKFHDEFSVFSSQFSVLSRRSPLRE
jgi:hypothetical protein